MTKKLKKEKKTKKKNEIFNGFFDRSVEHDQIFLLLFFSHFIDEQQENNKMKKNLWEGHFQSKSNERKVFIVFLIWLIFEFFSFFNEKKKMNWKSTFFLLLFSR